MLMRCEHRWKHDLSWRNLGQVTKFQPDRLLLKSFLVAVSRASRPRGAVQRWDEQSSVPLRTVSASTLKKKCFCGFEL